MAEVSWLPRKGPSSKGSRPSKHVRVVSLCDALFGPVVLPDHPIALARRALQLSAVENLHAAAVVLNHFFPLQYSRGQAHARPVGAQHGGQEIVGDRQRRGGY